MCACVLPCMAEVNHCFLFFTPSTVFHGVVLRGFRLVQRWYCSESPKSNPSLPDRLSCGSVGNSNRRRSNSKKSEGKKKVWGMRLIKEVRWIKVRVGRRRPNWSKKRGGVTKKGLDSCIRRWKAQRETKLNEKNIRGKNWCPMQNGSASEEWGKNIGLLYAASTVT